MVTSAARTATGQSSAVRTKDGNLGLFLNITAASGTTPTLDIAVQWSADGTTFGAAQAADTFTQATAISAAAKYFTPKAAFYRIAWTIGGTTPSFTFTVDELTW